MSALSIRLLFFLFSVSACSVPFKCAYGQRLNNEKTKALLQEVLTRYYPNGESGTYHFKQAARRLAHGAKPWDTYSWRPEGQFTVISSGSKLYIEDSVKAGPKYRQRILYYEPDSLFTIGYGRSKPEKVSPTEASDYLLTASLYSPCLFIHDALAALDRGTPVTVDTLRAFRIRYNRADGSNIELTLSRKSLQLFKARITYQHELYGKVVRELRYSKFRHHPISGALYASHVLDRDFDLGIRMNELQIEADSAAMDLQKINQAIPSDYRLSVPDKPVPSISHQEYKKNIYLLDLPHTQERSLLVEFKDFLLVAEAPLNTENGRMILEEAKKIAPKKPVKYFVFGHHHPHYIGGIRAFAQAGCTLLYHPSNDAYVKRICQQRTNRPELNVSYLDSAYVISDGKQEMHILHIGKESRHTDDYLIYYFPKHKLLFQDDLAWIKEDGPLKRASGRQQGLYQAIERRELDVETILQGWPSTGYGVKMEFSFEELERSFSLPAEE